jgi:hypothetical protein
MTHTKRRHSNAAEHSTDELNGGNSRYAQKTRVLPNNSSESRIVRRSDTADDSPDNTDAKYRRPQRTRTLPKRMSGPEVFINSDFVESTKSTSFSETSTAPKTRKSTITKKVSIKPVSECVHSSADDAQPSTAPAFNVPLLRVDVPASMISKSIAALSEAKSLSRTSQSKITGSALLSRFQPRKEKKI